MIIDCQKETDLKKLLKALDKVSERLMILDYNGVGYKKQVANQIDACKTIFNQSICDLQRSNEELRKEVSRLNETMAKLIDKLDAGQHKPAG